VGVRSLRTAPNEHTYTKSLTRKRPLSGVSVVPFGHGAIPTGHCGLGVAWSGRNGWLGLAGVAR